jgi:hypothetical protein
MMSRCQTALLAASAFAAIAGAERAQSSFRPAVRQAPAAAAVPSLAPTAAANPIYDPAQLPAQRGQVQQFTLTPHGEIDGLILADGTELVLPPRLSTQIAYSIKPGDTIVVHGLRAAALSLIQAVSITDEESGRTVIDDGPPPAVPLPPSGPAAGPGAPLPGLAEVQGRVRMVLRGPREDVNGALLEDGTVLRLRSPEAYRFASLLQPGQTLVAEGNNAVGRVLDARQLGASRTQLSFIEGPPGRGRHYPAPPPPGPEAPPPAPPQP